MKVHSIFQSISGEAGFFPQGSWCTFVRLQGCNLDCSWCDTKQAQELKLGFERTKNQIVQACTTKRVIITGGEPLVQRVDLAILCFLLHKAGKQVQIETNGSKEPFVGEDLSWVVDYKTPSSGMHCNMPLDVDFALCWKNMRAMIKFVVANTDDIVWSIDVMESLYVLGCQNLFIFSPINGDPDLVRLIISKVEDELSDYPELMDKIVISLQIHKLTGMA